MVGQGGGSVEKNRNTASGFEDCGDKKKKEKKK